MGPIDFLLHLANLFALSVLFGLAAAGGAKLIWRRALAAVAWWRLAAWAAGAAALVTVAGLVVFGRDGRMATYMLMVPAGALAVAWAGFRRKS
ncbi:MAG: hypothetical protein RJA10_4766 [Pseudomonadota bacterium]|jgi:hypothetical protein